MSGNKNSQSLSLVDRVASRTVPIPAAPVLVDGEPWDGRRLGDVAFVMTVNQNVVRQHRRVVQACTEAGLEVVLLYVDIGPGWNPSFEDYSDLGARIVQLPLSPRLAGISFPKPSVMIRMFAEVRAVWPVPPFSVLVTHIDDYGLCKLLCYWAKDRHLPSVVLQEGMTVIRESRGDSGTRLVPVVGPRTAVSWLYHKLPHEFFRNRIPYIYADYFCAYGEAAAREAMRHGRAQESIRIVGNPGLDHVIGLMPLRSIREGRRKLLYVHPDYTDRSLELKMFDQLSRVCCDENGDQLLIKLHPLTHWSLDELQRALPKTEQREQLLEFSSSGDAVDMLDDVDTLITVNSTTAYHALVKGIPVVTVSYFIEDYGDFDGYRYGASLDVRRPEDLREAVQKALSDESTRLALREGTIRLIEDHLFKLDGLASMRIAEVLTGLVEDSFANPGNSGGSGKL